MSGHVLYWSIIRNCIFIKTDAILQTSEIPWANSVVAGVGNTVVNLGRRIYLYRIL